MPSRGFLIVPDLQRRNESAQRRANLRVALDRHCATGRGLQLESAQYEYGLCLEPAQYQG